MPTNIQMAKITPKLAAKYLEQNKNNRVLNMHRVDQLAAAFKNGEYRQTYDPIRICKDGTLQDGQHRLSAIIKSGVTLDMMVASGLEPEAFDCIDIGKKRTAADMLGRHGEHNTSTLAAALFWVHNWEMAKGTDRGFVGCRGANQPRIAQSLALLKTHPGIRDYVAAAKHCRIITPSILAALAYIFSLTDKKLATRFLDGVVTGESLKKDCPIYHLRELLVKNATSKAKLSRNNLVTYAVKAWNMLRSGKPCAAGALRVVDGEAIPRIL